MAVAIPALAHADGVAAYSNHRGVDTFSWWGSNQAETYDVAVKIDAPEFIGLDINSLSFHVADNSEIENFKIWASKSLNLENKVNAPDLFSYQVSPEEGVITLALDAPCTISDGGIYIGYSFTVATAGNDVQKKPVAVIKDNAELGYNFYLHTSKIYGKWIDNGEKSHNLIPFEMTLSNLKGENVTVSLPEIIHGAIGHDIPVTATLTNEGWSGVQSATLSYSTPVSSGKVTVDCSGMPEGDFMQSGSVDFIIPAVDALCEGELTVAVTEVNGKPNEAAKAEASALFNVYSRLPRRTPLLEEYTGTDCGWCPRGGVGLEKMAELYGDRFVGVAYHCADVMSVIEESDYPNPAPAQPVAWIDRIRETDPYLGDVPVSDPAFGINKVWEEMAARFTPADMSISCDWTDDTRAAISVKCDVNFVKGFKDADFRMVYLLVENGLKGGGAAWSQGNYYSGDKEKWPADLAFLVDASNPIRGYVFNDVVIYTTDPKGIEGSLPSEILADSSCSHETTLSLDQCKNLSDESLVQNLDEISVVAVVVDAKSGDVVNCIEGMPSKSAVEEIISGTVVSTDYYNLQGMRIFNPAKGNPVIKVTTTSDGQKTTEKVIF